MKKISFIFLFLFIIMLVSVSAIGSSREPNKVLDIVDCHKDITLKVYPEFNNTYQFINCSFLNETDNTWICPCMSELYLQIPNSTTNSFSFTAQYYTDDLKLPINETENIVFNNGITRIQQINNYIITEKTDAEYIAEQKAIQKQADDMSMFIIIFIGSFFLICILIIFIFIILSKLRKKYKLEDDEKLTLKMIFQGIFSRPDINRKSIGDTGKKQKPVEVKISKPIETNNDDEVRKILERINK